MTRRDRIEQEAYDAVVFDLDGTLVRLAVDWAAVADEVAATLRERGVAPPDSLWEMLELSEETGHRRAVERILSKHERAGARASDRLEAADTIPSGPVGVCSLNCVDACHIALDVHGIDGVDAVVGRDSVSTEKPDPAPLLEALELLEVQPEDALFVGDTARDEETADRAGVAYVDVSEWLRAYA